MSGSRSASRTLLLFAVMALELTACSGGATKPATSGAAAPGAKQQDGVNQIDADPCKLLTLAEMSTALGDRDVEEGGLDPVPPGRCTFSVGGDIGAGVVSISVSDPMTCAAVRRALGSSNAGADSVRVDVGDGGFVAMAGGHIDFAVAKGCIKISASIHGRSLDPAPLLVLARAAAGRV